MNRYRPKYEEIVKNTGTPAYVFDMDVFKRRIEFLRQYLGEDIGICYAMKANPFVVGSIGEIVDRFEVCSPGEFKICERAKVPMDKVVLSGVYKEPVDTKRIVKTYRDSILYTAESVAQFNLVNEGACENAIVVDIILRITTGNQFGIDEKELRKIIENRNEYKGVNIVGIQHFSGTQRHNLKIYSQEIEYCDNLIASLEEDYGYVAKELEFGTGFYFEYFQPKEKKGEAIEDAVEDTFKFHSKAQDDARDIADEDEIKLLKEFSNLLHNMKFKGKKTLEIGRFIAATCGTYYTQIVDSKHNTGTQFCIVDGGIHQVNYFGQMMAMKLPWFRQLKSDGTVFRGSTKSCQVDEKVTKANLCGSLCTINDNLVKNMPLISPAVGDIIEFINTGAYSMTETPALFLSRDLPKVYLYTEAEGLKLMRDKVETNEFNYL